MSQEFRQRYIYPDAKAFLVNLSYGYIAQWRTPTTLDKPAGFIGSRQLVLSYQCSLVPLNRRLTRRPSIQLISLQARLNAHSSAKKRIAKTMAWTMIDDKLVRLLVNSTGLSSPGIWSRSPGDKIINRITAIAREINTILTRC
jgi:hypothetical protein